MISDDVRAYLIAQAPTLFTTSNTFAGQIPENVDTGIGIFEHHSLPPDKIAQLEFPVFSVQVRAAASPDSKLTAFNLAHEAYIVLNRQTDIFMNSINYKRVEARSSPEFNIKDEKQRFNYYITFVCIKPEEGLPVGGPFCNTTVYCNTTLYCGG